MRVFEAGRILDAMDAGRLTQKSRSFLVNTLVPGSYGLFGGLGPMGIDFPPYGPKSIHFRVSAPGYKTLVTEVEIDGEVRHAVKGCRTNTNPREIALLTRFPTPKKLSQPQPPNPTN